MTRFIVRCIFASTAATVLSAQYANVSIGKPIRYNDFLYGMLGQPALGYHDLGDTHACAWLNNGNELCTYNDGFYPITASAVPKLSNVGLDVMYSGDITTLTSANPLSDFGTATEVNTNGWRDSRTWKSSGIAPYNGCVYLTVQRQEGYDTTPDGAGLLGTVDNGFRNGSSAIIKSCDQGATWVNPWNSAASPLGNAPTGGHHLWPVGIRWIASHFYSVGQYVLDRHGHNQIANNSGTTGSTAPAWASAGGTTVDGTITWTDAGPAIAGFVPVTYCQDNTISCPASGADNFTSGPYIYLTAMGAGDTGAGSYTDYYLARVLKSDLPLLDVTKYQYWTGTPGGNITASANWSASMVNAKPIIFVTGMRSQVYYLAGLNEYLLVHDGEMGNFEFWLSSSLTGNWVKTYTAPAQQDFAEFPTVNMSTLSTTLTSPKQVQFRLEYGGSASSGQNAQTTQVRYSSSWEWVTMTATSVPSQSQSASSFRDTLASTGPGLIVDYAFLPELGSSVTDYSGNGHNGLVDSSVASARIATPYSTSGVWLNPQNPGNNSITGQYSVSVPTGVTGPFTLYIVYRKLQTPINNECLVIGSQISICRNAQNIDDWLITVNGRTTRWSDESTYAGAYYSTGYDGSWNMFVIDYDGANVGTYNNYSLFAGPHPVMPASGTLSGSSLTLGANGFSGEIARFALYSQSHNTSQIMATANAIISGLRPRGVDLSVPHSSGTYPLDNQFAPVGAWSVRRVLTSYTGPSMKLQNVTNNSFSDIPFDGLGNLDSSAIASFCGSTLSNCALSIWYDQSGHDNSLYVNSVDGHNSRLTTCGSNRRYCVYSDGYTSYTTRPDTGAAGGMADFFFYSFTGGVNAVMQVDQTNSSAAMRFATLGDGVADVDNNIATACFLQGNAPNTNMSWIRGGTFPAGISVPNNTLFSAFSWSASGNMRFELNGSWIAPTAIDGAISYQARLHAYQFALGYSSFPGAAGAWSEVVLTDSGFSGGTIRELQDSQRSYFGIP